MTNVENLMSLQSHDLLPLLMFSFFLNFEKWTLLLDNAADEKASNSEILSKIYISNSDGSVTFDNKEHAYAYDLRIDCKFVSKLAERYLLTHPDSGQAEIFELIEDYLIVHLTQQCWDQSLLCFSKALPVELKRKIVNQITMYATQYNMDSWKLFADFFLPVIQQCKQQTRLN